MEMFICSTGDRYRRCGFGFTREGATFTVDGETDDVKAHKIGSKTFEVLKAEAKGGRLSIMPASQAEMLASSGQAAQHISDLQSEMERMRRQFDGSYDEAREALHQCQDQLADAQDRLTKSEFQLAAAQERLVKTEGQLAAAQARIAELETQVGAAASKPAKKSPV